MARRPGRRAPKARPARPIPPAVQAARAEARAMVARYLAATGARRNAAARALEGAIELRLARAIAAVDSLLARRPDAKLFEVLGATHRPNVRAL